MKLYWYFISNQFFSSLEKILMFWVTLFRDIIQQKGMQKFPQFSLTAKEGAPFSHTSVITKIINQMFTTKVGAGPLTFPLNPPLYNNSVLSGVCLKKRNFGSFSSENEMLSKKTWFLNIFKNDVNCKKVIILFFAMCPCLDS